MIKIPYDELILKIVEKSNLNREEVEEKVKQKMDQLSGLISKEGAAHIVANELGLQLFKTSGRIKVKEIHPGMRDVEVVGKVIQVYDVREFSTGKRQGKVRSLVLGDDTGTIRLVFWNDQTEKITNLKEGDILKVKNGYIKENNNQIELHLNDRSNILINPAGETVEGVEAKQNQSHERKYIKDLSEKDMNVEIIATIVQIFEPRFFEVCPECGKRIKQREESFFCDRHNKVLPNYGYVLNLFLDDGTGNMRAVCFRRILEKLIKKNPEEIIQYKDNPELFEEIKTELLGNIVKFIGRVSKNEMFDRLELICNDVYTDINPEEEIERLKQEMEQASSNETN